MKYIFYVLLIFTLCSCQTNYQYGVYVKNSTSQELRIRFKSLLDVDSKSKQEVVLKPNTIKRIIWTEDLDLKSDSTEKYDEQCQTIAEYVNAYNEQSVISSKEWCSDQIQFEITDIGQAEYTIEYFDSDFIQ